MHKDAKGKMLLNIFLIFLKIGAFTFGGGYAMIPIIEREFVDKREWISRDDIVDIFAVGQSVPGAIAINSCSFIGYKIAGTVGSLVAIVGMVIPSFVIITAIAMLATHFQDLPVVQKAFAGIRAGIVALILMSAIRMTKAAAKDYLALVILIVCALLVFIFDVNPIYLILLSIIAGIIAYRVDPKKMEQVTKGEK